MKILILGSTGFVGRNLVDGLSLHYQIYKASRNPTDSSFIYFDLHNTNSWKSIVELSPDLIINSAAYGVIKHEKDFELMYSINYLQIADFYDFLMASQVNPFWIQLGTAFEYDLTLTGGITEETNCLPKTHYGISKLMFSNFLQKKASVGSYSIFRPFGMFGKYEDESKFFPMLIKAQQNKQGIKLSEGVQERDYIFINDLADFIQLLVERKHLNQLPPVLNIGAGETQSLREYASLLATTISHYDPSLWQWGSIEFRTNESLRFYNSSELSLTVGFKKSDLKEAFSKTTLHYYSYL